jgi:hypothetical protein
VSKFVSPAGVARVDTEDAGMLLLEVTMTQNNDTSKSNSRLMFEHFTIIGGTDPILGFDLGVVHDKFL